MPESMSDYEYQEYQKLIGMRIKNYRVAGGLSQQDLENRSGVSVRSISRLEQGASVQMESLIKILIALGLGPNITALIPDQTRRPSYYLTEEPAVNRRVRRTKNKNSNQFKFL